MLPEESQVINFLASLYADGLAYESIKCARSALASVIMVDFSESKLIKKLMKGIFLSRPSLKVNATWDANAVIDFYAKQGLAKLLNLRQLTIKMLILLSLVTAQRRQSLSLIDIRNVEFYDDYMLLRHTDLLKTSRPGFHQAEIKIRKYRHDKTVCPVTHVKEYMKRTKKLRFNDTNTVHNLLLTTQKPYKAASVSTIGGWIKSGLIAAGIDMEKFTPHSTRAASTSAMKRNISVDNILKMAGWTSKRTFTKYYDKTVQEGVSIDSLRGSNRIQ